MHVIQSQFTHYNFLDRVQKQIKLVRWWRLAHNSGGKEMAVPFTAEEEDILVKFIDDHPYNFPKEKREIFDSFNLIPPVLDQEDQETDVEKPCILIIQRNIKNPLTEICRRMDIVLQNDQLPISLPFDIAGEIILEKV